MKRVLLAFGFIIMYLNAKAQVTITSNDMPVKGDTLRYSTSIALGFNIDLNDTGANKVWNFDTLTPVAQRVDEYKAALQVNPLYGLISVSAYGYEVFDTLPTASAPIPVTVTEVYTFFNKKGTAPNDRYVAEAYAAKVSGTPTPAVYNNEDELFFFPLAYGNKDTSDYYLNLQLPLGSMVQKGERITKVDAWGTIKTPYHTTAQNCIRVRSSVEGVDSVLAPPLINIGLPRNTVDYYWLIPGEHYPALWVTTTNTGGTETVSSVRYRDKYRMLSVNEFNGQTAKNSISIYPNPAKNIVHINISSTNLVAEVFDMQGRLITTVNNERTLNISTWADGTYIIRTIIDGEVGYTTFVKE